VSRVLRPTDFRYPLYDLSGGIIGNLSEAAVGRVKFLKHGNNTVFEPPRSVSSRPGSRALSSATLSSAGHSLGKLRPTTGTRRLFVGRGTGISLAAAGSYTNQTMPGSAVFGGAQLRFEQLNDVLWVTEHGGINKPFGYIEGIGWIPIDSPIVAPTPNFTVGAAGNVDVGKHYYRVRQRFVNGASLATTPVLVNPGVASKVDIGTVTALPTTGPGGRTDWLGWTIERTKANDPKDAAGTYYQVAFGTTATYQDNTADALLWDAVTDGWYTGPQVFSGVIAFRQRMFGWIGSLLYPSWEIAAAAQLGIFNFDPINALRVGADDGDVIQTATDRAGQLIIFKSRSIHVLDGTDLSTFDIIDVPSTGGAAGPRCACTVGGENVIFYNDDGLFRVKRNGCEPFGWEQVGHYLSDILDSRRDKVVLRAIGTRYLIVNYSAGNSSFNNEALLYDFRTRTWDHYTNFNAEDLLYSEDSDFTNARVIVADGQDQGGSTFQCWIEHDGVLSRRAQDGTGGGSIPFYIETPLLDLGYPESWKELSRITLSATSETQDATVTITAENGDAISTSVQFAAHGNVWGDDSVPVGSNDLVWDTGVWAGDEDQEGVVVPIPRGLLSRRFKVALSLNASAPFRFSGMAIEGRIRPERRYVS